MAIILDGRVVRAARKQILIERIKEMIKNAGAPCMAIIQIGSRGDSSAYINAKRKFAAEIGVTERHIQLPESTGEQEVLTLIDELNHDARVQGIIMQLPLPAGLNQDRIIDAIAPAKDIDGLTATNVKKWLGAEQTGAMVPATARGVKELLDFYNISFTGKKVVMVGRSLLVGKPIAALALAANATVTVCHSKTVDLPAITREADILIVAIGKARYIGPSYVKNGQVVIDIGTNTTDAGSLVGDVDFDAVKDIVGAITPVPGGVGQMTVLALFENLIDACEAA